MALLAASCWAQQEIDPDHFDGNDSWALVAAHKALAVRTEFSTVATHMLARHGGPAATSDLSKGQSQFAALNDRRKGSSRQFPRAQGHDSILKKSAGRGMVSQSPSQFCHSEHKRLMASKCVGQE